MKYKTWKFRLMSGYKRRKMGAGLLLRAQSHLTALPYLNALIMGRDTSPYRTERDTPAYELISSIWLEDGNFYRNRCEFPVWRSRAESVRQTLRWRLTLLKAAFVENKSIGYED